MRRALGGNYSSEALDNRERMTKTAVSRIWQIGPAATLQECRELAAVVKAELCESAAMQFDDALDAEELRALLERAAAMLKKL